MTANAGLPSPSGDNGLKRQVASALFWVALAQVASRGLAFVTLLILAKLVAPAMFGLVGMAMVALNALALFQDIGFESALIYRRKALDEASHTAFVTVILSSLALTVLALAAAPLVGRFFREEAVVPVMRVLALTILISSVGRVPLVLLSRELDFRRRIFPELTASVIASIAAIVLALRGFGVWSLVWRELLRVTLSSVLVWFVSPYRPRWQFNPAAARDLFAYGKHIVSSQTLIFLITNVDNAIIGRYVGDAALGFYQFAYNTSNQPATQIAGVLTQVMFPVFSKMADGDPAQARIMRARYYLTTVRYVTWITTPIAVATILFAPAFIRGLYGEVWAPAIVPLQLLAVYGFIRSIAANMGSVFRALGKPQWLTWIAVWRLVTMAGLLIPVSLRWGIDGVSWLSAIVAVVDFVISAWLVGKLVDAPWRAYVRMLAPTWAAALAAGLVALWLYPALPFVKAAFNLLLAGGLLVAGYLALAWLIDPRLRETLRAGWRWLQRVLHGRKPVPAGQASTGAKPGL
ncbi:MAG: Teichuronic acid biosynthesis protein TuaB [Chloroflexi bacterium ADurb.Bin325]|nr:MAG: Teichuronic acid biosynthesis protein TuaB [Chloroflexi bacterium ADurb.Bin325]